MQIFRKGERPSKPAPQEYFTGSVTITPINEAPEPATLRALHVAFTAGARTHWHTHPLGQTLHVVSGRGLIQCRGEAAQIIEPGDT
ncbi:MAG: cupin domain-containing protein, partial [Pseudomonadota bacterium]